MLDNIKMRYSNWKLKSAIVKEHGHDPVACMEELAQQKRRDNLGWTE